MTRLNCECSDMLLILHPEHQDTIAAEAKAAFEGSDVPAYDTFAQLVSNLVRPRLTIWRRAKMGLNGHSSVSRRPS